MATIGPDEFRRRAGQAYEWGRFRHAAAKAWPALPLTAVSSWLCHEPGLSVAIGVGLFTLLTGLVWYGRIATHAARAGLKAGMVAFAVPVVAFHAYPAPCCPLSVLVIINGACGIGVGVLLSIESTRLQAHYNVFLLFASVVSTLCGMLGCILFGPIGLAGMAMGVLLSTAPVAIFRRVTA
jgi:hypothetical protein